MKNFFCFLFFIIISGSLLNASEKEIKNSDADYSNYNFNNDYKKAITFYADSDSETSASVNDSRNKGLFVVNIVHGVIGGISWLDMIALCVIGNIMLAQTYNDGLSQEGEDEDEADSSTSASADSSTSASSKSYFTTEAYTALKLSHRILTITTYSLMGSSLLMAFITLGIKIYKKMPVNVPHFISAIITTAFYLLEFISAGVTAWAYSAHVPNASYYGLFHGIFSYIVLASFTVTLITLPIGWNNRRVLGNKT